MSAPAPDRPVVLRALEPADVGALLALARRNRAHFAPFEPPRPPGYFTLTGQRERLERDRREAAEGSGHALGIFLPEGRLVGRLALSGIDPAGRDAAHVGYAVDHEQTGRGLATAALREAVALAFGPLNLPGLQATVAPTNRPSLRVLEKVGFGPASTQRYLLAGGGWRPHRVYVLEPS